MRSALAAAGALLVLGASAAHAQTSYATPEAGAAPAAGSQGAWGGQDGQRPQLTPEQQQARHAMREACAADMQKLCSDASANAQRPFQCMRQHMSEVSPACSSAMQAMRAARRGGGAAAPAAEGNMTQR